MNTHRSSTERPLSLTKRRDLTARRQRYLGRGYWMVKEPLGLTYTRLRDEEFAILEMLQNGASLASVKQQFDRRFAPQFISFEQLQQFIDTLHRRGLSTRNAAGQELVDQARRQLSAANDSGRKLQWHFAEEEAATLFKRRLSRLGLGGIEILHTPMKF